MCECVTVRIGCGVGQGARWTVINRLELFYISSMALLPPFTLLSSLLTINTKTVCMYACECLYMPSWLCLYCTEHCSGNAMGYIRMIRSGGMNCVSGAIRCVA